ncbi:hypothetical protein [uncultured Paraglaciecola sp.]|uniref:hypothetical protein n=1 Tax=uncultured Paraglaciecola sp. TaxID=1765024 RepID=UPI0030DAB2DE
MTFVVKKIYVTLCLVWVLLLTSTSSHSAIDIIKHVNSRSDRDQQKTYYVALLKLAIEKAQHKFGPASLQSFGTSMVYQRKLMSLNSGKLDVMWAITSEQRERDLLPIMIPVLKGLIGYRVMVIQDTKQQALTQIISTQQIKNMVAIQGIDWVDTDVLLANGFKVETSDWHNSLYKGVSKGHYDYFPRSILEPWAEMQKYRFDNLVVENKHLLYYPAAMYFFVQKDNKALAQRLEYGLNQAIDDGSFDKLFYNYPAHQEALSKGKLSSRVMHKLSNPFLPKTAPLNDKRLWHKLH